MSLASLLFALLFYVAAAVLVGGLAYRIVGYARTPAPLKIPTTPAPTTSGGVAFRLFREVVFFESLFKSNLWTWALGWLFHGALALVLLRHLRYFTEPVWGWVAVAQPFGMYAGLTMLLGLCGLWIRRLFVERIRYISTPSDHLMLVLLIGIAASGLLMSFVTHADVITVKTFFLGWMQLDIRHLPADFVLYFHLLSVAALVAIFGTAGAVGSAFSAGSSVPGSGSAAGFEVLEEHFPGLGTGGQSGTIVFTAEQGVDGLPALGGRADDLGQRRIVGGHSLAPAIGHLPELPAGRQRVNLAHVSAPDHDSALERLHRQRRDRRSAAHGTAETLAQGGVALGVLRHVELVEHLLVLEPQGFLHAFQALVMGAGEAVILGADEHHAHLQFCHINRRKGRFGGGVEQAKGQQRRHQGQAEKFDAQGRFCGVEHGALLC